MRKISNTAIWPLCLAALLLITGCTRKVYIPLEREREVHDTVYSMLERIDTIMVRDSAVTEVRGDTVRMEVWRWRERVRQVRDTVIRVRTDTVRIEKAVNIKDKQPENKSFVSRRKSIFGWIVPAIVVLIAAAVISRLREKGQKMRSRYS